MSKWIFNEGKVAQEIQALAAESRIPELKIQEGNDVLKRHQKKLYPSAIIFGAPKDSSNCGRYNPPGGKFGVLYAADSALTAAAEAYGRLFHQNEPIAFPLSELKQHYICSINVVRTVKVIDIVALCELLHIPSNNFESEEYHFTQWLMEYLYTHFGNEYDGIAYTSRHKRYKRCYAFWERPGFEQAFEDALDGMVPYASYVETDTGIFPAGSGITTMTGEEMFEELLNFRIIFLPE